MGTGTAVTGVALAGNQNTFDVTGHTADLKFSTVSIGTQNRNADLLNVFSFDTGTLEIGSLNASSKGSNGFLTTTILNIGGGTVTSGAWTLGSASGAGNAEATANLTGGSLTFSGSILSGNDAVGGGTVTATVNLNGAALNMGSQTIGSATNPVTFSALSGSLTNLAELNGGGLLTKSTAGVLTLGNGNTYTGGTTVSAGTLVAANSSGSATGAGAVTVSSGATLAGNGFLAPASNTSITVDGMLLVGSTGDTVAQKLTVTTTGTGLTTVNGVVAFDLFGGQGSGTLNAQTGNNDQLVVSGTSGFTLGATSTLQVSTSLPITEGTWAVGTEWKLFDWSGLSGGVNGTFSNLSSPAPFNYVNLPDLSTIGLAWDVSNLYTAGTILVVVPEPGRMLLVFFGLLGLCFRRRR
jgi:autotransporter-associated beta strand protein